jgi:hypothetical protein
MVNNNDILNLLKYNGLEINRIVGDVNLDSCLDSWSGHAINIKGNEAIIPIGTLYYFLWIEKFCKMTNSKHTVLIADDLLDFHNKENNSKHKKEMKKTYLSLIKEKFNFKNINFIQLKDISTEKEFIKSLKKITNLFETDSIFQKELFKLIPKYYKETTINPEKYVLAEFAIIYYMNLFFPLRISFLGELGLNKLFLNKFQNNVNEIIYLKGDYKLNTSNDSSFYPPSKENNKDFRLCFEDTEKEIIKKLNNSTKFYTNYILNIIEMLNENNKTSFTIRNLHSILKL